MARTPTPAQTPATDPKMPANETAEQKPDEAKAPEVPETAEAPAAEVGTIPARVLVDHLHHRANTLALLTEAEAADCSGWADTDPAAVEYVRSLD